MVVCVETRLSLVVLGCTTIITELYDCMEIVTSEISMLLLGVLVFTLFVLYSAKSCNYLVDSVFQVSSLSCCSLLIRFCFNF